MAARNVTRSEVRQAFKAIGYAVSFRRNVTTDTLANLAFKSPDMLKPYVVQAANAISPEFYNQHKSAFELAVSFRGAFLADTEQKIV